MAVLRILDYPDPRLKTVAEPVKDVNDPAVQQMVADMLETLDNTPHCGGLAACQLDIAKPLQIFVFYDFDESNPNSPHVATVAINPEIIATEGEVLENEGCMSVHPDYIHAAVPRPAKTTMHAMNEKGEIKEYTRTGYLAKNFMHETDHLNGRVYIDHLKPLKRKMVDQKIVKLMKKLDRNAS